MRFDRMFRAIVIAFAGATAQPATSATPEEEVARCAATITSNRSLSVVISGHKFTCPGHIIVAEESEARRLHPGSSFANAYFKGALIYHGTRPNHRVLYFVIVENWADAQRCRVLVGPMRINNGPLRSVGPGSLSGNWVNIAHRLVTAATNKWADAFEFKRCVRGVSPDGAEITIGTTSVNLFAKPQHGGPRHYVGTWGPITGARAVKLSIANTLLDQAIHFVRAGHDHNDCWNESATVILRDGGSLGTTEIARIQGGTPEPGQQLTFMACYTSAGTAPILSVISFNLEWQR